ncbi:P22 phage major capsid protein family protein [Corynebacterium sp. YSMAA1_1_F7]|uniref:P22 phage major capsid protein family protein n=1 Tax=Corynebacterium sp. YSMAA1_1_F7 TaxID=3383590 RepID=UPI0038D1DCB2
MAFLTADIIAKQALATLHESLVVKPLIHTDLTKEFSKAKVGDTINIRKPAVFESKKFNRAKGIEVQAANEESIPVKLDQFDDVSFQVTAEELALDIEDFDAQLLTPAMQAISGGIDVALLGLSDKVTATVGTEAGFEHNKPESLIQAGAILDANKVPQEERFALVGPATKAHWLNTPILKQADQSGSTEALRRASLGNNVFGFDTYMTSNIKAPADAQAGDPSTEVGLAFHKSAFAFASAPLEVPAGAAGHVETYDGISVRVVMQYDISKKATTVSVDTLYGVSLLDPARAVLIKGADKE